MRLRMLTIVAGPLGVWYPGGVYDVQDVNLAKGLLGGGYAQRVDESEVPAVLSVPPVVSIDDSPEPAAVAPRRGRRGRQ